MDYFSIKCNIIPNFSDECEDTSTDDVGLSTRSSDATICGLDDSAPGCGDV